MAEVTDDFGRVNNFADAAIETIKKILTAAVGDAVKYAKTNEENIKKYEQDVVSTYSELDKNHKENIKNQQELLKKTEEVSSSIENLKNIAKEQEKSFKSMQQEQLKFFSSILDNQRRAQSAKIASFTAATPRATKTKTSTSFKDSSPTDIVVRQTYRKPKQRVENIFVDQKIKGYNKGGLVGLINNIFGKLDNRDKVLAGLEPGEFVLRKNAANRIGRKNLERLNQADKLPKYSKGGVVKGFVGGGGVPPPARGTRTVAGAIRKALGIETPEPVVTPETQSVYSDLGQELADYAGYNFKLRWRKNVAAWLTSVSSLMLGGQADFFKVLFGGSVVDVTNFRREVRALAFEIEGITSATTDLQNRFGDMGKSINETGKSIDAVQKLYLQNSKKGFKSQKDGLKTIKSGLYLSTMIGSETEQTANLFSDWYRTLNLSADQMGRLARDSRFVAMSTGVTGDELVGAMRASESILKNLKNQGNLTSSTAKNVIEMMAQAKKLGIEDQAGKVLGALSGTTALLNADQKTKTFILSMTSRMGRGATQSALQGTFMQDRTNLAKFADQMNGLINQLTGGRAKGVQDVDKLDAQSRMRLSIQLQGITGMEIDEFKRTQEIFDSSSKTLGDKLASLEKQINKRTATESEKLKASQQKQMLLLNASAGFLSNLSDAANRDENLTMADAVQDAMNKLSGDERKDLDQLITRLDASTMAKLNMFGVDEKKFLAAGLLSAQKLREAAKAQGLSVKDFGPELIDAMQKGDMARLRSVSEELNQASQRLDIEMKMATDPITKLAFTLNQYNETIRTYTSKFVGAILDLLGPMNLLAVQIGMLAAGLYVTFGKDLLSHFGFDALFKISDFRKASQNPFANMGGAMGNAARRTKIEGTLFQRIVKRWSKALQYIDLGLGRMGKKIGDFFRQGKFLPKTFKNVYRSGRTGFFGSRSGVLSSLIRAASAQIVAFAQGAFRTFAKPIIGGFEWLFESISSIIPDNSRFIQAAVTKTKNAFSMVTTSFSGLAGSLSRFNFRNIGSQVWAGLRMLGRGILNIPVLIADGLSALVNGIWAGLRMLGRGILNIPILITDGLSALASGFSSLPRLFERGSIKLFKGIGDIIEGGFKVLRAPLKVARRLPVLNLIFAVIDGIIGAFSGFMSTAETFKEAVADSELGYGKVTAGMYAASTAGGALAGILDGILFGIPSLLGLRKPIEEFFSFLIFGVMDSLYEFGRGMYDAFNIDWLMNQFSELGVMVKNTINQIFGTDFKTMGEVFAGLMKTLKPFFYMLGKVVGFLASAIINVIGGVLVGALKIVVGIIQGISALVKGIMWFFSDEGSWQGLFDGIYNNMKWAWDGVVHWMSGLGATLYDGFTKALQDVWTWFTSWSKDSRTDEQKAAYDQLQKLYAQRSALGPAERRWYEISSQRSDRAKKELPAIQSEISRLEQIAVAPGVLWGSASKTVAQTNGSVPSPPTNATSFSNPKPNVVGTTDFSSEKLVATQSDLIDQGETSLKQGRITMEASEQQMTPGSIYVHDVRAVYWLQKILGVLGEAYKIDINLEKLKIE
jgi:hypothetical protein